MDLIKWRKARKSDGQGGACVEVAQVSQAVAIRDSKDPDGPKLLLSHDNFRAILNDLKH
ncbi:DUF397 domain-containing protein [Actinomadura sp. 7K534]|uniref:DUF397 domain-containing protein n=1 Tax=Actinomadura sp. 7K534 TaxID=2530366 RepID=UPI001046FF2F|nr:DUF397 domain-containing protein [Actinomadura sp. 7K534]TDB92964.1 DUF397 domain-containing protein [Actinomadura sp. 7K534]